MAVEIGHLVLRGTFGPNRPEVPAMAETRLQEALDELRRDLLAETRDMIEDALRRQKGR